MKNNSIRQKVKESNIKLHDLTASWYETGSPTVLEVMDQLRINEAVYFLFKSGEGQRFLDIGCGTGIILDHAAELFKVIVGMDISMGMLKICRKNHQKLVLADSDFLSFQDATFDAISCYATLHHLYDQEELFRECFRILKDKGIFYSDFDPNSLIDKTVAGRIYLASGKIYTLLKKLIRPRAEAAKTVWSDATDSPEMQEVAKMAEYHRHYGEGLTPVGIKKKLESAGFKNIKILTHDEFSSLNFKNDKKKKLRFFAGLLSLITFRLKPDFLPYIMIIARKQS